MDGVVLTFRIETGHTVQGDNDARLSNRAHIEEVLSRNPPGCEVLASEEQLPLDWFGGLDHRLNRSDQALIPVDAFQALFNMKFAWLPSFGIQAGKTCASSEPDK